MSSWCSSEEVNILLGWPSIPSRCCRPKSHSTAVVAVVTACRVEVSVGLLLKAVEENTRSAASTANSAAIERTR